MPNHVIALIFAIIAETVATSALKASEQFTKTGPSIVVVIGYGISFYLLSYAVRFMPIGIVYAIWSGLGIVLVAMIGWLYFKQSLDIAAIIGLSLILGGIVIINVFSEVGSAH